MPQLTLPPRLRTPGRQPVREASGLRVRCWVAPTKCATLRVTLTHCTDCTVHQTVHPVRRGLVTRRKAPAPLSSFKGLVISPIRVRRSSLPVVALSCDGPTDSKADAVATRWSLSLLGRRAAPRRGHTRQANWAKQILSVECHHEKPNLANVRQMKPSTLLCFPARFPDFPLCASPRERRPTPTRRQFRGARDTETPTPTPWT